MRVEPHLVEPQVVEPVSVAMEDPQKSFLCHETTVTEDEADFVHLNCNQKEKQFRKISLTRRMYPREKMTVALKGMLKGRQEKRK